MSTPEFKLMAARGRAKAAEIRQEPGGMVEIVEDFPW